MSSAYESYLKFSNEKNYEDKESFQEKFQEIFEKDKDELEDLFHSEEGDKKNYLTDSQLIVLLILGYKKADMNITADKNNCDKCDTESNVLVTLRKCFHSFCQDCLEPKINESTNGSMQYVDFFKVDTLCELDDGNCKTQIKYSDIKKIFDLQGKENYGKPIAYYDCEKCKKKESGDHYTFSCKKKCCIKEFREYIVDNRDEINTQTKTYKCMFCKSEEHLNNLLEELKIDY